MKVSSRPTLRALAAKQWDDEQTCVIQQTKPLRVVGRYALYSEMGRGGMSSVHFATSKGNGTSRKIAAIKSFYAEYAKNQNFVAAYTDEARKLASLRHPNIVSLLDVMKSEGELMLVMDYVAGENLAVLARVEDDDDTTMPPGIVARVMVSALTGLHAAHEAVGERGEPLGLVHRDFSPQNILVGTDGNASVVDFGIARAAGIPRTSEDGSVKPKIAYTAPELAKGGQVDRRTDIYSAGIVLWESLVGQPLANEGGTLPSPVPPPSRKVANVPVALDAVVMKALSAKGEGRFSTALEMAQAIEKSIPLASLAEVGAWVRRRAENAIESRVATVELIERSAGVDDQVDEPSQPVAAAPSTYAPAVVPLGAAVAPAPVDFASLRRQTRKKLPLPVIVPALLLLMVLVWRLASYAVSHDDTQAPSATTPAATSH